jgi:hypothetical protein
MKMMQTRILLPLVLSAALALVACGKKEEPKPAPQTKAPTTTTPAPSPAPAPAGITVSSVTAGKAVGADKKITAPTESFSKDDTMYVSIDTTGSGTAKLDAKWTYRKGDQVALVKEETMTINASGPATNEFHVSKPDGWPAGDYEVEVILDGKPAGSKKLTVK